MSEEETREAEAFLSDFTEILASGLSELLGVDVNLSDGERDAISGPDLNRPYVVLTLVYAEELPVSHVILFQEQDAVVIAGMMLGREEEDPEELSEFYLAALQEAFDEVVALVADSFAGDHPLRPYDFELNKMDAEELKRLAAEDEDERLWTAQMLSIGTVVESEIVQSLPSELEYRGFERAGIDGDDEAASGDGGSESALDGEREEEKNENGGAAGEDREEEDLPAVDADGAVELGGERISFDLIEDVELPVRVILGKTELSLEEVAETEQGSLVSLDGHEGEHVEVLVEETLVARGKIVAVGDHYGIEIMEVVQPEAGIDRALKGSRD